MKKLWKVLNRKFRIVSQETLTQKNTSIMQLDAKIKVLENDKEYMFKVIDSWMEQHAKERKSADFWKIQAAKFKNETVEIRKQLAIEEYANELAVFEFKKESATVIKREMNNKSLRLKMHHEMKMKNKYKNKKEQLQKQIYKINDDIQKFIETYEA